MMKQLNNLLFLILSLSSINGLIGAPLLFDSRYSMIQISPGATFSIDQPIANYSGTLNRQAGGTLTGSVISFVDGIFEDNGPGGSFNYLSSVLNPTTNALTLGGNSFFRALPGTVLQSVSVSATSNLIMGAPFFNGPISLTNAST